MSIATSHSIQLASHPSVPLRFWKEAKNFDFAPMFRRARRGCELPSHHLQPNVTSRSQALLFASRERVQPRSLFLYNRSISTFHLRSIHHGRHPALSSAVAQNGSKSTPPNQCRRRSPNLTPTCETFSHSFLAPTISQQRRFSSTPAAMTATKIDGTAIAKKIRDKIHTDIENVQKTNPRFKPSLKIIQGTTVCPP